MTQYTDNASGRSAEEAPRVVCVWCGAVIRGGVPKAAKRMCQPCFERMMREHLGRNPRPRHGLTYESER